MDFRFKNLSLGRENCTVVVYLISYRDTLVLSNNVFCRIASAQAQVLDSVSNSNQQQFRKSLGSDAISGDYKAEYRKCGAFVDIVLSMAHLDSPCTPTPHPPPPTPHPPRALTTSQEMYTLSAGHKR